MQRNAGTDFGLVGGGQPDSGVGERRPWAALLVVLSMLVVAGFLLTGGDRLERSEEPLAGFEIRATSSTRLITTDFASGWSSARLDTLGAFVDIAEHAGRLIAVEQSPYASQLWASDAGSSWDPIPGTTAVFETASVELITRIGNSWIAAGSDRSNHMWVSDPAVWYSVDGEQWSRSQELPRGVAERSDGYEGGTVLTVVETTGGMILAGGTSNNGATIWTSGDDGRTWELAFREGVYSTIRSLVEIDGGYLAIGDRNLRGATWHSVDGGTWVRGHGSELPVSGSREYPWDVVDLENRWVAVGGLGADRFYESEQEERERPPVLWSSSDGEAWDRDLLDGLVGVDFAEAVVVSGRIVAVGSRTLDGERHAGVWWSDDGRSWESNMLHPPGSVDSRITGIVGSGDRLIAVGQSESGPFVWVWDVDGPVSIGTSYRSEFAPGRWVDQGVVLTERPWDINRTEHGLVAPSERGLAVSADGRDWTLRSFEEMGIAQPTWVNSLPSGEPPYYMALWSESDRWWVVRSEDGESWQVAWDEGESGTWGVIAAGSAGALMTVELPRDGRSMLFSPDGGTWEPVLPPSDGFPGGIFAFRDDFFVSMASEWDNAAGSLWKYTPPGDWVEVMEVGYVDAFGMESFVFESEFYLYQRWGEDRALRATADGVVWREVELPAIVLGSDVSIEPTAAGLLLTEVVWDELHSWPARIWMLPPTGQWIELPPISAAGFEILLIPGSDAPSLLSIEGFGQTRLWEWVEG